ncbi:MAG TPA: SGNH hydrolase domain-containing protein, partial [Solirubrobacterales bacterium]|nr:SGNH hydrolase domain-containing protein [Solirubrobacterales bacterium]
MIKGVLAVSLASLLVLAGVARADQGTEWIPPLDAVARDKGEMAFDGCRPKPERIDPVMCVYGDPDSDKTIALFGDSHAMEWGPPLIRLAQRRGWRLVTFLRAGCVIADVKFQNNCDEWRELAFQEIAEQRPNRVIVSTSIGRRYTLSVRGETLSRTESEKILRRGMARTLKRLASIRSLTPHGTKVKLIRDQITAPFLPPRCLADHPDHPRLCRFPRKRKFGPGFDVVGA